MLLLAHPLHANRHAGQRARDQRGVGGGIVGAVVAVASGSLDMDQRTLAGGTRNISAMRLRGPDRRPGVCVHTVMVPSIELRHGA